jgi:hypothetical protein
MRLAFTSEGYLLPTTIVFIKKKHYILTPLWGTCIAIVNTCIINPLPAINDIVASLLPDCACSSSLGKASVKADEKANIEQDLHPSRVQCSAH